MIFPNHRRLTLALSAILLTGSQVYPLHAADSDYSGIAAPPKFTPGSSAYPPPPPGGWDAVVDSIDKQVEADKQAVESSAPGAGAPLATGGSQPAPAGGARYGAGTRFPEFQDPPEWGRPEMPSPPEWGGQPGQQRAEPPMPQPPQWAEPDSNQQPAWAQQQRGAGQPGGGFAPPEWGGGAMPEPPEWGAREMPEPPEWGARGMPQQPQRAGQSPAGQQQWSREIPDPPDWGRMPPPRYPPYSRGPGSRGYAGPGRSPWDRGRSRKRDKGFSPFGSSGPSFDAPWDDRRGGSSAPWSRGKKGRSGWMDKDWFADSWDDMLNAPADMGEMPGGWTAPTISTPNPVDVGDEFGTAAEDMPTQMRNVYDDNRRSNQYDDRYDRYDRYDNRYRR